MSMTQSFDYNNTNSTGNTGAAPTDDFDLQNAQLDEASASDENQGFGPGNILGGGIGNLTQTATQVVSHFYFS